MVHYPGRKRVGYFGAERLRDGRGLFRKELGIFNNDNVTFWDFLRQLETLSRELNRKVIAIGDNSRFHHAKLHATWREEIQGQFHLDSLTYYGP